MKYAIIELNGKQYRVSEGDSLVVDQLNPELIGKNDIVTVNDVLLVKDETETKVGAPLVANASVTFKHVKEQKGDKIRVFKFKAKSRYRKTQGFRASETVLEVQKIAV